MLLNNTKCVIDHIHDWMEVSGGDTLCKFPLILLNVVTSVLQEISECNDFRVAILLAISKMKHCLCSLSRLYSSATMKDLKIIIYWK